MFAYLLCIFCRISQRKYYVNEKKVKEGTQMEEVDSYYIAVQPRS